MRRRVSEQAHSHMIGGLFTFALFAMFIVLSLLIVVIGVNGYKDVVDKSESVSELRTSLGYVAAKLRSDVASDGVWLQTHEGVPVLALQQVDEDGVHDTLIYHWNGALYELSKNALYTDFELDDGWPLLDVAGFEMAVLEDNLIRLTATAASGEVQTMHVSIRTGGHANE